MKFQNKEVRKIVFSEKIDDNINGYSVGLTFIAVALFLLWRNDYLRNDIVTQIVGTVVAILGILMCATQLSKTTQIKGLDSFAIGAVFFFIWLIVYLKINWVIFNLFGLALLAGGFYGMIRGMMEICYSVWTRIIISPESKPKSVKLKEIFLLITQMFGFLLTILNILKIFGLVGS